MRYTNTVNLFCKHTLYCYQPVLIEFDQKFKVWINSINNDVYNIEIKHFVLKR